MNSALAVVYLLWVSPLAAEEVAAYESLQGLSFGRVFFSREERAILDRKRQQKPLAITRADSAAGYIVGQSGRVRIWRHGEFRDSVESQSAVLSIPGAIRIERHDWLPGDDGNAEQ